MAPGSISSHIFFRSTFICIFSFLHLYYKIPKIYLSYHTISIRSYFRKWPWRDWPPLCRVGCEFFVCLCRFVGLVRSLLLDWYLGSQKLGEILTLLLLHHPFLFKGKPTQCSRGSKKDFWCRCRGDVLQVKTYQVPIIKSSPSHYIICHSPLVFLSPHC